MHLYIYLLFCVFIVRVILVFFYLSAVLFLFPSIYNKNEYWMRDASACIIFLFSLCRCFCCCSLWSKCSEWTRVHEMEYKFICQREKRKKDERSSWASVREFTSDVLQHEQYLWLNHSDFDLMVQHRDLQSFSFCFEWERNDSIRWNSWMKKSLWLSLKTTREKTLRKNRRRINIFRNSLSDLENAETTNLIKMSPNNYCMH